ncbi:alpha/beta hydrolase-fold protein [Gilliamella apicola]
MLGNDVHYTVYLPPDYNSSNRTYPIFYFLHGGA